MNQHYKSSLSISNFQFNSLILRVIGILLIGAQLNAGPPEGFSPLFDGKTFNGWEGNKDYFRIEEGAVVAGNLGNGLHRRSRKGRPSQTGMKDDAGGVDHPVQPSPAPVFQTPTQDHLDFR